MKKRGLFIGIIITSIILSSALISAASYDFQMASDIVQRGLDGVIGFTSPVFEKVIGDYNTSDFFFAKVLILFLLIFICNGVLRKTPIGKDNKKVSVIVSIIIGVLAVRFISQSNLIQSILIPYGTLGVAITTLLPLIIFFYFIHNSGIKSFGRKAAWIAFGVMFIAIWLYQSSKVSPLGNWIYGSTIVIVLVCAWFDKDFHYYFGSERLHKAMEKINERSERFLLKDLDELREDYRWGRVDRDKFEKESKELKEKLAKLGAE